MNKVYIRGFCAGVLIVFLLEVAWTIRDFFTSPRPLLPANSSPDNLAAFLFLTMFLAVVFGGSLGLMLAEDGHIRVK